MGVLVLDALTSRQWVREEDLAKELNLRPKQLRQTLVLFEEERCVSRYHRRETATKTAAKGAKTTTHSYCCLDYEQIYDVVRYRLHRMKKKLMDEVEEGKNNDSVEEYVCPNCDKRYNALDALRLVSMEDEYFHCERCDGKLAAQGGDDNNARIRRREKLKDMLEKMEVQFQPLIQILEKLENLPVPKFESLPSWELARARANANANANGDPEIEVSFSGFAKKQSDSPKRQVGVKVKRDSDDDIDREDPVPATGLNEDDDVDWEEG